MARILIEGGHRLEGSVRVSGAKNAVLPILAASLLAAEGISEIDEVPHLLDVENMANTVAALGAVVEWKRGGVRINAQNIHSVTPPYDLVRRMRASFVVAGPLLARFGEASIALPGGCNIGPRPVDLHIKGLEAMGAKATVENGFVHLKAPAGGLRGARIYLDIPSVGATQNIMMAAALAEGQTVIENAAKEPENVDLANYLNAMGARVRGAGTDIIRIDGVDVMHGASHSVIPDRIEAGTFLVAGALMGNGLYVENAVSQHIMSLIAKLEEAGAQIEDRVDGIKVWPCESGRMRPLDVKTHYYPSYPTDMQAQMLAALTVASGTSTVTETVFENRFMHVAELQRMGANIHIEGRTAVVDGVDRLSGARVTSTDLRAGAALVIAGLMADGLTEVHGLHHIDRGYDNLVGKFQAIGAKIERYDDEETIPLRAESAG
ncbi:MULTISPECIES: UDP-N-acetylglucosamine 1-carboxyvinyltransferase [Alicyclobacillus]|uniref:UDP-N-acetylglucosamine 1-carboxyvinyltransferase n=1 Tax=Alicyclobacillus acidoterrestris (strain ATCC 49025 / DSM 3922 / CIP 106132 / NCIMB 13137 / GD3B) TaxID=1356854 RepID=T0D764_ALIAG|nr:MULTISPECIES: UDP-N-acetylglucosamine 1-carboxyvinyltransferase [Alicyclobacillus]EPZ45551.1 UDP-N-acetylglucosamine 1-carboxyvinyltransferase [Alicyclobacillus acidoterrestris ATCC 49025]UNO49518.1 UDP-N-acetylglucosamine 1-carboxyvinyltransferase [Alicyclobacillus acidoterrestris]